MNPKFRNSYHIMNKCMADDLTEPSRLCGDGGIFFWRTVHQKDISMHEKILRHFDLSSQYGVGPFSFFLS